MQSPPLYFRLLTIIKVRILFLPKSIIQTRNTLHSSGKLARNNLIILIIIKIFLVTFSLLHYSYYFLFSHLINPKLLSPFFILRTTIFSCCLYVFCHSIWKLLMFFSRHNSHTKVVFVGILAGFIFFFVSSIIMVPSPTFFLTSSILMC